MSDKCQNIYKPTANLCIKQTKSS